jgi:GNAT superfamily N-acetyltransferase
MRASLRMTLLMNVSVSIADEADAPSLAALQSAVADDLTRRNGHGVWSSHVTEKGILFGLRHSRVLIARRGRKIVGKLQLQNKKPWAIDISYFTPVSKSVYLIGMAVLPGLQHKGIGRRLLEAAAQEARDWPAEAIRLDAFDAEAGAGGFYVKCGFRECGRRIYRKTPLVYFEMILRA